MEDSITMQYRGIGRGRGNRTSIKPVVNPCFDINDKLNFTDDLNKENLENRKQCKQKRVRQHRNVYIPDDFAEDYQLHVNSGINFDNYDAAEVEVKGRNAPSSISSIDDIQMPFFLKENIVNYDYKKLTPVQKFAIPIIDCGRDMMASAQTGSGKTVAFLVPIIKALYKAPKDFQYHGDAPRCIIIVPTRELCRQIFTVAQRLCSNSPIRCAYLYGGIDVQTLMEKLHKCDILVTTPCQLTFNIKTSETFLSRLTYLVLDEADRLLEEVKFFEAIKMIYSKANKSDVKKFQVLMFSATFPRQIQRLAESLMVNFLFVAVGMVGSASLDIRQEILYVTKSSKLDTLLRYITENKTGKTLIFVGSKRFADFLGIRLIDSKFMASTIHGDRNQYFREIALNNFKSGRVDILVSTDVASRGLDIPGVDTVLNFDMPDCIDVYIHRIGRTGRCGNPGLSVSFFDPVVNRPMASQLVKVLKDANQKCPIWLERMSNVPQFVQNPIEENCQRKVLSKVDDGFMNNNDDFF